MRKNLTSNSETELTIDELMDGEDMTAQFTRDSFKKMINEGFLVKLEAFLEACKKEIFEDKKLTFESLELVGEATRIPVIQDYVKEKLAPDMELSRTLNS